jgi:hypothetical protein
MLENPRCCLDALPKGAFPGKKHCFKLLTVQDLRTDFTFFFDRNQFSDTDPYCQGSDLWIW